MKSTRRYSISKPVFLLGAALLALTVFIADRVEAQDGTLPPDSGCMTCHENLYYLYDTGKWFCQCETQMTCTCCHGGNPDALTEEEAHQGMVLYPTRNDATACQQCHPDDYQERAERFAEIAGVSQIHPVPPTITPDASGSGLVPVGTGLQERLLEPRRFAALIVLGLVLVAIVIFGFRCWRADSLARKNR